MGEQVKSDISMSLDGFITGPNAGDGVRLFDHPPTNPLELEATRVIESPAVTHLKFRVPK